MTNTTIKCRCGFIYSVTYDVTSDADHLVLKCPNCKTWANRCLQCPYITFNSRNKNDLRSLRTHIARAHPTKVGDHLMNCDVEDDVLTGLGPQRNNDVHEDDVDCCSDSPDNDCYDDGFETSLQSDTEDVILQETVNPTDVGVYYPHTVNDRMQEMTHFDDFKFFGNKESDAYFWQEYLCNQGDEAYGGLRGVVWRSLFRRKLYDISRISSLSDTRLLFNMTDHTMSNSQSENDTFFDILEDIIDKTNATEFKVKVPLDNNAASQVLMDTEFGIYGNLPYENVFEVNQHACVSLVGILKQMYALGIPIGFTHETDIPGKERDWSNTNGSVAMSNLLETMKELNSDNKPTKYGSFIFWSDGFLRSFVKQKNNNVWILTVTFPDPNGSATSKYHTYCLAVGKSSNDHQPVIDYFLKEIETLSNGVDVFCPKEGRFVRLQMGLLAYIADRPERHSILNQSQGGTFGKRTLWSCVVDYKNLPYCHACFGRELKNLLDDKYSTSTLQQCGRCCQWNMNSPSRANNKVKPSEVSVAEKYPTASDPLSPTPPENRSVPTIF